MARIKLQGLSSFGEDINNITSVSWKVESPSNVILFQSLNDSTNKTSIIATLRNPNNSLYEPSLGSTAYAKLHVPGFTYPWVVASCS